MVEQDPSQKRARKETPLQAFNTAKKSFNSTLLGESYDFDTLKTNYLNIKTSGTKAARDPKELFNQLVSFGEQAGIKAEANQDLQGAGYFSGLVEGFQMTLDALSENQAQKPAPQPRSMNQAKA